MKGWTWQHAALALGAFLIIAVALTSTGVAPGEAWARMASAVSTPAGWRDIFAKMTPLMIAGTAVFLGLRAGLFNIGAEGQILMGGLGALLAAFWLPNAAGIVAGLAAAALFGAAWSLPAGLIRAYRGGHEVISTIMLNQIAFLLCAFLAKGVLKDPGQQSATSADIAQAAELPNLISAPPFRMNLGLLFGVILVLGLAWWLKKTVSGYELQALGANAKAAEHAGVRAKPLMAAAMAASGGLAGLSGGILVLGFDHRFYANLAGGYGFDALGVALLSGASAWAIIPSAFFFALVDAGTSRLAFLGIPKGMSALLLGLVILVFAASQYRRVKAHE